MAVQINLGPLSVDLEKLLVIIKELFSIKLDHEAKDAIKELIDELMKLHDDIVKTLLPFYDIIDDVKATPEKVTAMGAKGYEPVQSCGGVGFITASVVNPFSKILGITYDQPLPRDSSYDQESKLERA
jgi:hypothetical protein